MYFQPQPSSPIHENPISGKEEVRTCEHTHIHTHTADSKGHADRSSLKPFILIITTPTITHMITRIPISIKPCCIFTVLVIRKPLGTKR